MQSFIETAVKKTKYTDKTLKKSHENTKKPLYNKESRVKLKRKADKKLVDIIDDVIDGETYSDDETIPYAEPYRATTKKTKYTEEKLRKKA